jgi:Flp pilus assembly protein TadG
MKSMLRWLKRRGEYGQTLAEFSLILPVIAIIIFGLVDMARAMQSYVTIQEAARDGARYAVTGRIDCVGPVVQNRENCIEQAVLDRVDSLNNVDTIATTYRRWDYPAVQCDAVEVQVNYTYQPITPIFRTLVRNSIPMVAKERLVNEPFGTCN